jgi:hypothetical protein
MNTWLRAAVPAVALACLVTLGLLPTPASARPIAPPSTEAPACQCTAPTTGLTQLATHTRIRSQSVSTVVVIPAGLPVPNPTEVSILFGDRRVTTTYNTATGTQIPFDFAAGDGKPRTEHVTINYTERANGTATPFHYLRDVPVEARYDVTVSALRFRLIHDCDFVGKSEPLIEWGDDKGAHHRELSMHGGQYATITSFARSASGIRAADGWQRPLVTWDELDPTTDFRSSPAGGLGPLLPGVSSTTDFETLEPDGDPCRGQFHYDTTITLLRYTYL